MAVEIERKFLVKKDKDQQLLNDIKGTPYLKKKFVKRKVFY